MVIVTGDRYLERLVRFAEEQAGPLIDGSIVLKLNPAGLHYVQSRLESLHELENLLSGAPVDYLRAYVSDLEDHRALEQLRRILKLLTSLRVVSVLPHPSRDPTPLSLLPFGRLRVLELLGCDLSTSAVKGLLELRHTLEKIICHNSTDALRHVFSSRITELKDSPQWYRLSFVSCACNDLVLMDESLQLLPSVEILDLSRNKFAKVDNLRKCTKLKHLDVGFNQLRTISSFSEVSCSIIKLVLRNNALTTLCGLENLKSLEGLDVSYNIISNFSEIEFISGLPSLQDLWLEGNPLCCAWWYRAHVFSYFPHPDILKLDDEEISTREFWKRQIIIASRQKFPASFGFYSPAKDGTEGEEDVRWKRRRVSRLASIESDEESAKSSDQDSISCNNETQSKEEHLSSDDRAEITHLINKVELMKKERSVLWLRDFKEWMDHECENYVDISSNWDPTFPQEMEKLKHDAFQKHLGESSKYNANAFQASVDEINTNPLESDNAFVDVSKSSCSEVAMPNMEKVNFQHICHKFLLREGSGIDSEQKSSLNISTLQKVAKKFDTGSLSPLAAVEDRTGSYSSSNLLGSPPHYQEGILQRRHNLVEEILQSSADSCSFASLDSDTSSSEDEDTLSEFAPTTYECGQLRNIEYPNSRLGGDSSSYPFKGMDCGQGDRTDQKGENQHNLYLDSEQFSCMQEISTSNNNGFPVVFLHDGVAEYVKEGADGLETREKKRELRRQVITLSNDGFNSARLLTKSTGSFCACEADLSSGERKLTAGGDESHKLGYRRNLQTPGTAKPEKAIMGGISDSLIEDYFKENIADSRVNESCEKYLFCDCVLEPESLFREREVALLYSSANKLYVLLIGLGFDGSGCSVSLLNWHRIDDITEVLVGLGLQVVRVSIKMGPTYLFMTRDNEKSWELLCILKVFAPSASNETCVLRSLEQVQVEFFEKEICGGSKMSIFQYSVVLLLHKDNEGEYWLSRSLFVTGGHVLICVENFKHFCSSLGASSTSYFSLDSCCPIRDLFVLVIDTKSRCITLALDRDRAGTGLTSKAHKDGRMLVNYDVASSPSTWKLKWQSEEDLMKFVAILKAIHSGLSTSLLPIRYVS